MGPSFLKIYLLCFVVKILFPSIAVFLNALKPDTDDGGDIISDDNLFTAGADCDCPIACDETVYSQELSIADLKADSVFFDRLQNEVLI